MITTRTMIATRGGHNHCIMGRLGLRGGGALCRTPREQALTNEPVEGFIGRLAGKHRSTERRRR